MNKFYVVGLLLFTLSSSSFAQTSVGTYFQLLQQAEQHKKYDSMLVYSQKLDELRPNHPTVLYYLALSQTLTRQLQASEKTLSKLALISAKSEILEDSIFQTHLKSSQLKRLSKLWAYQNKTITTASQAFLLPAKHVEGIAFLDTDEIAFASVYEPAIGFVSKTDTFLLPMQMPVMALAYQAQTQKLWGVSSDFEFASTHSEKTKGKASIFCIDILTKKILFEYLLEEKPSHSLGEIKISPDGNIYCTDSVNPIIYKWNENTKKLETAWTNPIWRSLQGITFSTDNKWIFVADYSSTIYQINRQTNEITALNPPKGFSFKTTDGLYFYKNQLITIQNGTYPMRVTIFELDITKKQVRKGTILEQNNTFFNEPTTGIIWQDKLYFIANSQWQNYNNNQLIGDFKPVVILKIDLN